MKIKFIIIMVAALVAGCKDQKAIQLAQINAESAMAEGNIEKAIESYRILLVHDKDDGVAKTNLTLLEGSLKAIQGERFLVFNKNINQLIIDTNKIQKLKRASQTAADLEARHSFFSLVKSKIAKEKDMSAKIYRAMLWLEESSKLVNSIEDRYQAFYTLLNAKPLKAASEPSSIGYLIDLNNQWKSVLRIVDNVRVRDDLEGWNINVRDVQGEWLSSARVIFQVHDKIDLLGTNFKDRYSEILQGWDAGEKLIEHIEPRNKAMAN